jgi:hypothetical protein
MDSQVPENHLLYQEDQETFHNYFLGKLVSHLIHLKLMLKIISYGTFFVQST